MEGIIIKGIGGYYYLKDDNGNICQCRARGKFRKEGITPLVGDRAVFETENGVDGGYIIDLLPRKNKLVRPAVANIDNLVIIISATKPKPDLLLCDKLIIQALLQGIRPIICINKTENMSEEKLSRLKEQYDQFDVVCVSAKTQKNIDELEKRIYGKINAFAGQSAVGKSSILNAVNNEIGRRIGGLSAKTDRGKHTTREVELVFCKNINGYVIDTPGFSIFEAIDIEENELKCYYPEFLDYNDACRFSSCLHIDEPECAVRQAVSNEKINKERYERYRVLIEFLKERREKKYD